MFLYSAVSSPRDCSKHFTLHTVCSQVLIQFIELWQCGMNEIANASKQQQEDSNPGSLD